MSWLRMDDGFAFHPKLVLLSRSERWTWVELLCYCARYKTAGEIPANVHHVIPKATRTFLSRCVDIGLLDRDEQTSGCSIHDWAEYNPKDPGAAARMQKFRATNPTADDTGRWKRTRAAVFARDNGICADCGKDCKKPGDGRDVWNADHEPPRDVLLERGDSIYDVAFIVTRCHSCHSRKTRRQQTEQRTEQSPNSEPNELVTRARASRPVPITNQPTVPKDAVGLALETNIGKIDVLKDIA